MRERLRSHLAIALASFAVLFYQVAITRVLSVVLWYHFAFLSISLALLGVGAPGVWFALRRRGTPGKEGLARLLLVAGAAIPLSVVAIVKGAALLRGGDRVVDASTDFLSPVVLLCLASILIPFLLLGAAVCVLLLRAEGRRIGAMYSADLIGATLGALVVVPLMHVVPTPALLAASGLAPIAAAALISGKRMGAAVLAVALVGALIWGEPFHLRHTKKYAKVSNVLHEKWTPTGRITVFPDMFHHPDPGQAFAWGMGSRWQPRRIPQLWIEQDASAGTPITKWTGSWEDLPHLLFDVTGVAYQVRTPERVCVIGAGGGRDILAALQAGASHVDAVELNRHTIDAVSGPFREFSGDVYRMPGVRAIASEGRSYLTRSEGGYDLIQISMVDSWAATSAGAFALSENYLYTVEALELYWDRLSDRGMTSISRWMLAQHLVEGVRLVNLAQETLRRIGVADPGSHLVVVQGGAVMTLLMSRSPFTPADIATLDQVCNARGFVRHWPVHPGTPQNSPVAALAVGKQFRQPGIDVSAPTDDRPFFFQAVPVLGAVDSEFVKRLSVNEQAVVLLRRLVVIVTATALALFLLPFVARSRMHAPHFWRGSGYFTAIGLAFLLVEAAWVQRFILYLGHPSYATTVVLAALLAGAGAGSWRANSLPVSAASTWGFAVPVFLAAVNLAMTPLFQETLGWSLPGRVVVSLALLVPSGFLMGFAFPMGMIRFGDTAKPWYWALNGAFSVLASVLSLATAMLWGHAAVAYVGAVCYGAAFLLLRRSSSRAASSKSSGSGRTPVQSSKEAHA